MAAKEETVEGFSCLGRVLGRTRFLGGWDFGQTEAGVIGVGRRRMPTGKGLAEGRVAMAGPSQSTGN